MTEGPFSDGRPRQWVKRENLGDGGWMVRCGLCGKKFVRIFKPERNEDPQQQASDYVGSHLSSPEHLAAVEAYRAPAESSLTKEQMLLRAIFGEKAGDEDPEKMRRSAARLAAERELRK